MFERAFIVIAAITSYYTPIILLNEVNSARVIGFYRGKKEAIRYVIPTMSYNLYSVSAKSRVGIRNIFVEDGISTVNALDWQSMVMF
jgi:hypothetical protein